MGKSVSFACFCIFRTLNLGNLDKRCLINIQYSLCASCFLAKNGYTVIVGGLISDFYMESDVIYGGWRLLVLTSLYKNENRDDNDDTNTMIGMKF